MRIMQKWNCSEDAELNFDIDKTVRKNFGSHSGGGMQSGFCGRGAYAKCNGEVKNEIPMPAKKISDDANIISKCVYTNK